MPTRNSGLLQWLLSQGFRMLWPTLLISQAVHGAEGRISAGHQLLIGSRPAARVESTDVWVIDIGR